MLQELITLLTDNKLYIVKTISDLDTSKHCVSSKLAIDYDKVKDEYCKGKPISSPKSADALIINPIDNKISFIEMKEFIAVFQEIKEKNCTEGEAKDLIHKAYVEFEADKKILDSVMLLLDITRHFKIDLTFFPYFISDDCKKEFYFVMGCSPRDYVRWSISISSLKYKYKYFKLGNVEFIPANNFNQAFP